MKLSVVVPAFNEEKRIRQNLQTIIHFLQQRAACWELIVVDDGSTDGTVEEARTVADVQVLRNKGNRGKGFSVRRGVLHSRLDFVLFTDADLSTPIEEAISLYEALEEGADVAIASRKHARRKEVRRTPFRKLLATAFRICVKTLALRGFHDTQCGFKMFRREVVSPIFGLQRLDRWGFDVEILLIARRNGLRIAEVPVDWNESEESSLTAGAPFSMLLDLLRIRWHALLGHYRHRWNQTGRTQGD